MKNSEKKPYTVKHKRQTTEDFTKDLHRFQIVYNGKESEAQCVDSCSVFFDDESIPDDIQCEIMDDIYDMIDRSENNWSVPKGAQEIANAYCKEEFIS